jgi:DNA-binding transcriptional regulator YiaG
MKKDRKIETIVYEDLGFPILLVNCPMKKVFGEWMLDINLAQLQEIVLRLLIYKPSSLTKDELRFIRKHFELTTTKFGQFFGVTHTAVLKWESGQVRPQPTTEIFIRLFVLENLCAKSDEFLKLYHEIRPADLLKQRRSNLDFQPVKIDADELKTA